MSIQPSCPSPLRSARDRGMGCGRRGSDRSATAVPGADLSPAFRRRGFNLVELMAVLSIVVILVGTLMPGLRMARESAQRIVCAANLRQIGSAMQAYLGDHRDRLPFSTHSQPGSHQPREMMAATAGIDDDGITRFDGLGLLAIPGRMYLDSHRCLYCPSHCGDHEADRYLGRFAALEGEGEIFTNYHYRGDFDVAAGRRLDISRHRRALVADGMRTPRDFNHRVGTNVLFSDASVDWLVDTDREILSGLQTVQNASASAGQEIFRRIWESLDPPKP
jgi:prepilin-type N-terminal cleavage/methylation domain-containing protein